MPDKTFRFELTARYFDESDPPGSPPRWEAPLSYRGLPYAAVVGMQGALLSMLQTLQGWGESRSGGGQPQFTPDRGEASDAGFEHG